MHEARIAKHSSLFALVPMLQRLWNLSRALGHKSLCHATMELLSIWMKDRYAGRRQADVLMLPAERRRCAWSTMGLGRATLFRLPE